MDDESIIGNKLKEQIHLMGKDRLTLQIVPGQSMNLGGRKGDLPFRIEITVKCTSTRQMIDKLQAAKFNDPVSIVWV